MVYWKFRAGRMSSIDFELFPVCLSFRPYIFQKEKSQFSSAVFSVSTSCESQANFVLQIY